MHLFSFLFRRRCVGCGIAGCRGFVAAASAAVAATMAPFGAAPSAGFGGCALARLRSAFSPAGLSPGLRAPDLRFGWDFWRCCPLAFVPSCAGCSAFGAV